MRTVPGGVGKECCVDQHEETFLDQPYSVVTEDGPDRCVVGSQHEGNLSGPAILDGDRGVAPIDVLLVTNTRETVLDQPYLVVIGG